MLVEYLAEKKRAAMAKTAATYDPFVMIKHKAGKEAIQLKGPFTSKVWQLLKAHAPKATLYAGVGGVVIGGAIGYHKLKKRIQHHQGYERMLEVHPSLKSEDPTLVKTRYNALFNLAPTLARDPLVAGSIVKQWIEYPVVSATTLKDVARAEADLRPSRVFLPELLGAGHVLAGG